MFLRFMTHTSLTLDNNSSFAFIYARIQSIDPTQTTDHNQYQQSITIVVSHYYSVRNNLSFPLISHQCTSTSTTGLLSSNPNNNTNQSFVSIDLFCRVSCVAIAHQRIHMYGRFFAFSTHISLANINARI
jgi:hypothetical protein